MSRRLTAAWCARISGVVGAVSGAALLAFFGLARPFGPDPDPTKDWLGPLNDATSIVQFAALVPVAVALRRRLAGTPGAGRPVLVATDVATAAMAVFVGAQALLVAGVVPFAQQAPVSTAAALVVLGWTVLVSRMGARTGGLPRPVVLVGTGTGVLVVSSVVLGGAGFLLPATGARDLVLLLALVVGALGWFGIVPWTYLLGSTGALTPVGTGGDAERAENEYLATRDAGADTGDRADRRTT